MFGIYKFSGQQNNYLKKQASSVVELACVCYSTLTIIDFKSFLLELVPYNSSYLPGIVRMVLVLSSKNSNDSLSSVIPAFAKFIADHIFRLCGCRPGYTFY